MAVANDKSKRYDRGIRVWGAHGQEALEAARVCLLNAGPTGTEALKNLVLGGIHSFTVVDGAKVTPADLGNNFLLTADGLASSRAQVATGEFKLCQMPGYPLAFVPRSTWRVVRCIIMAVHGRKGRERERGEPLCPTWGGRGAAEAPAEQHKGWAPFFDVAAVKLCCAHPPTPLQSA